MAALVGLCFGGNKIKEPFQSIHARLLDGVQAGILDLSAVELFGAEAQIDTKGAAAALQSFWQEVVKSKKEGLSLVGLESFDLCSAALLQPNSISRSAVPEHATFFTKALFDKAQAKGTAATKKVLYESLAIWVDVVPDKTKKAKDLRNKAATLIQDQGMDVKPPQEDLECDEGISPPEPKTSTEEWLQQLLSLRPQPLVVRGMFADWQLLPVLLRASSHPPSDTFSFKDLAATLAETFGGTFSPLTEAVLSAVTDSSIRLGKLGRGPPAKLTLGMLRQFSQEVVKGALKNLQAAEFRILGAGAVVLKAIAVFMDEAAREPRVEESDSDDSESPRPPKPAPTTLSNFEGYAWNLLLAMIFQGVAVSPKMKGQVHPGYLSAVLKPAFAAMVGEIPAASSLTKEQLDTVCGTGESFIDTARACLRHFAEKADNKEVLRFMHAGFVRRQAARDFAQLGLELPQRSRANTEIELRSEPAPSPKPKPRVSIRSNPEEEARLREIFDKCDTNGDGTLNKRELIKMCRASVDTATFFGLPANIRQEDGTRDLLEAKFQRMDQNDDREVNWAEFVDWYESEVLLEQERASASDAAEGKASSTDADPRMNAKKSLVGEDSDSEDEEFREAGPSYTGGFGVQSQSIHALTSMSSDGRPLVEDIEEVDTVDGDHGDQGDDRQLAERFLEFIFDEVSGEKEDSQGITRRELVEALAASWEHYGDSFEQFDDVSEELAMLHLGRLEFVDHFLSEDMAEPLHGLRLLQPPQEPWPAIQKVQEAKASDTRGRGADIARAAAAATAATTAPAATEASVDEVAPEASADAVVAVANTPVVEVTPVEAADLSDEVEQFAKPAEAVHSEEVQPSEPADESASLQEEVMEATIELPDAESLPDGTEQIRGPPTVSYEEPPEEDAVEVEPLPMKSLPPDNWFTDESVPAVPPPPPMPDVVAHQDPSGGLPMIPSARGPVRGPDVDGEIAPAKAELNTSVLSTAANTSMEESQTLAFASSDKVLPTFTFNPQEESVVQSLPDDQEVAVAAPPGRPEDEGSAPPVSSRTEPLTARTEVTTPLSEVSPIVHEAHPERADARPISVPPLAIATLQEASFDEGLVVVCEQNEAHLVPVPEEKRRSFGDIRDQLKTEPSRTSHPLSQPKSMQPAKPLQVNFSQQRLSQVCLRDVEEHDDRGHGSATGTTIYDDFRGLPRKLQEQVASLYQELEETKECKRRAEQENVEIMNYLSAILNDDTPAQYALTMGPLDSLPPGPQEEEEEGDEEGGKLPAEETASPLRAPEPFEPPPPLPFPAERVSAAPHLVSQPPPAPDFLSKPLVNISFGGGPPESWGSSTETRRPADVLQESLATVLPTAFRQLLDRPQALAEQQMQHFQERQQLQQSLQQVQQQLQQLQQQVSQGKKPETPLHSQRSLLEQLRAELAAERRRMQEQQRLQMEQEQQKQVQQQHLLEQLSRQMLQTPQDQPHLSSEVQRMLSELRTSGEATIAELRIALDELRQSKQRLDRQASMPAMPFPEQASTPMPFAMEQETTSLPRAFRKQSPLWEEPIHAPPSLLRSPPAAPPDIFGVTIAGSKSEPACPHCGQVYLPNAFFCRSCQMKRHLPEVLHRLPPGRRRGQPVQPLQVPRSVIFDKELARWDSRAEQLEARFRRLRDARR